ncbi:MAG: endolytic transglycosylase MltG [Acutalibacteraceae bacterium]
MKRVKVAFAVVLMCLTLLSASCSKQEEKKPETTTEIPAASSEYDLSQAVDAFAQVTDKNETEKNGETDSAIEKTVSPTEKATAQITASRTNAASTAAQTEKPTTQPEKKTVRITIKEGQTLTQIFKTLEENGVSSFDDLMETAQTYDYSYYPLVAAIPSNPNRCFKLEGYLFPDTYEFYTNQKPQDAIGKFLRGGKAKITDSMKAQASALGYSMDEVITVASIIEKEGANPNEVAKIAAVIYNRLEAGMKLQMDSTIYYIERNVKPFITGDINRYNSYYNTYKCSALPAGPISNPGLRTINAALNPADVPYLYFCHDENANYYYAETYEEHQENLKTAGLA